jgi:hypothetical protein
MACWSTSTTQGADGFPGTGARARASSQSMRHSRTREKGKTEDDPSPSCTLVLVCRPLVARWGERFTPLLLLGVNDTEIAGHNQHEKRARPPDIVHDRFHGGPPILDP